MALKDDEKTVVGKGKTAKEALVDANFNGFKNPSLLFVPKKLISFAGHEVSI